MARQEENADKENSAKERKSTVLVIAESAKVADREKRKNRSDRKVRHIKMVTIPNSQKETILEAVGQRVPNDATSTTDGHKSYFRLEQEIQKVTQVVATGATRVKSFHGCISVYPMPRDGFLEFITQ